MCIEYHKIGIVIDKGVIEKSKSNVKISTK